MDEKNNTPDNPQSIPPAQEDIRGLIKGMIQEQNLTVPFADNNPSGSKNEKTPLENLKNVLSHIDNAAVTFEKQTSPVSVTSRSDAASVAAHTIPKPSPAKENKPSIIASGPVAELDKLIASYRAQAGT